MFLVGSVRWMATSLAFHLAITYASFLALKRPSDIRTLKLWMILSVITATSYVLGDVLSLVIPMFMEIRAILVWGILIMEPVGWADAYDKMCAPLLIGVVTSMRDASRSGYTKVCVLGLVEVSLVVTNRFLAIAESVEALNDSARTRALADQLRGEISESKKCFQQAK